MEQAKVEIKKVKKQKTVVDKKKLSFEEDDEIGKKFEMIFT